MGGSTSFLRTRDLSRNRRPKPHSDSKKRLMQSDPYWGSWKEVSHVKRGRTHDFPMINKKKEKMPGQSPLGCAEVYVLRTHLSIGATVRTMSRNPPKHED